MLKTVSARCSSWAADARRWYGRRMDRLGPSASALELAAALHRRELSAIELLDACLERVDELNGELAAVVWRDDDSARAAAAEADRRLGAGEQAPFLGVPLPIKDLTPVAGLKPSRGRVPRLAQSWLGAVVEGVLTRTVADAAVVLDAISWPDPQAWYNAPAPERPFAEETRTPPRPLRIGLMAQAPLGIPTDPHCSAAARAAAAALESLGHAVEEVEVPTVSEELIAPFIVLTQGGLADYEGVDWSAVEPHIAHQRRLSGEVSAYEYALAARTLERLSREQTARWGRDFDALVTPTSAILPPEAGKTLLAAHA